MTYQPDGRTSEAPENQRVDRLEGNDLRLRTCAGHLAEEPLSVGTVSRLRHIDELYRMLVDVMVTRTTTEWTRLLEAADIPVMPMHTIDSLMEDPHLQAVGFVEPVDHPTEGRLLQIGVPSTWSKSQPRVTRHAPRAGEHGRQVLAEAGYTDEEIDALAASGITALSRAVRPL